MSCDFICLFFFFFNDTATTEIYTLSLHDALPIYFAPPRRRPAAGPVPPPDRGTPPGRNPPRSHVLDGEDELGPNLLQRVQPRSEEHTSELQSRQYLVCRLLLEKKKNVKIKVNNE